MSTSEAAVDSRRRVLVRGALLALAAAGVAAVGYVVSVVPPTADSFYPKCHFHYLTGLHCPGCGTTRAVHALLNGRVDQALAYNALAFVLLPVVLVSVARSLWAWLWGHEPRPRRRWSHRTVKWMTWALVAAMLAFWVVRNIPIYPFTLLAPHEIAG